MTEFRLTICCALLLGICMTACNRTERLRVTVGEPAAASSEASGPAASAAVPSRVETNEDGPSPIAVVVGPDAHEFEMIPKGGQASHTFVIRNDGDDVLELERHLVSCELCVHTEFQTGVVQPGEEIAIEVELRATKPQQVLVESLELKTNDPQKKHITLNLSAFVPEAVSASVKSLTVDTMSTAQRSASFTVYGHYSDKLEIIEHEFTGTKNGEFFDIELRKLTSAELKDMRRVQAGYEVLVHIEKGLPIGRIHQNIRMVVRCDEEDDIEVVVPVYGVVKGEVSFLEGGDYVVSRNTLKLGRAKRGKGLRKTMHVRVAGPHRDDVVLTVGAVDPEGVLLATLGEAKVLSSGNRIYPLTLSVDKDAAPVNRFSTQQTKPGFVVIKTTHPAIDELKLKVTFAIE
jgi:hypothetical protein